MLAFLHAVPIGEQNCIWSFAKCYFETFLHNFPTVTMTLGNNLMLMVLQVLISHNWLTKGLLPEVERSFINQMIQLNYHKTRHDDRLCTLSFCFGA